MSAFRLRPPAFLLIAALLAIAGLAGCSWLPDKTDETKGWSAAKFYSEAKDALDSGNYAQAVKYYEKLQARYPFGKYAQQAQLESIYANYKDNEPDAAIAAADSFIKVNPRHPYVDYAYYMKGLVNFNRADGPIDRLLPPDPTRTDSTTAMQSFNDFNELIIKFPDSKYAPDARQRMVFLRNNLASYEVNVAKFYVERGAYVAAANRAKYVLENYSTSPAKTDALAVMTRAYAAMGMRDLARDSLRVLRQNAPGYAELPSLTALVEGGAKS